MYTNNSYSRDCYATAASSVRKTSLVMTTLLAVSMLNFPIVAAELLVFTHANVIPMDSERVLQDQTLVVRDGRIVKLAPSRDAHVAATSRNIDLEGRYVLPGLADMHVHLEHIADKHLLVLFVANGVTTVRGMDGRPQHIQWRDEIERGSLVGPTIVTAGPLLDGDPPIFGDNLVITSIESAREQVTLQKRLGYDFIKVYTRLTRDVYDAIVDEARRQQLPVGGHVPAAVGLFAVLQSGQRSVEHLDGYLEKIEAKDSPWRGRWDYRKLYFAVPVDGEEITKIAEITREAGVWNCPTIVVGQLIDGRSTGQQLMARPEMTYVPAGKRTGWSFALLSAQRRLRNVPREDLDAGYRAKLQLVKALKDAGASLLLGTDCGTSFVVPGFSVHDELQNFVAAGLTPFQALTTATRAPAQFLQQGDEFGTVLPGRRADLVVVKDNPFDDLATLRAPEFVVVGGQLYSAAALHSLLGELVDRVN